MRIPTANAGDPMVRVQSATTFMTACISRRCVIHAHSIPVQSGVFEHLTPVRRPQTESALLISCANTTHTRTTKTCPHRSFAHGHVASRHFACLPRACPSCTEFISSIHTHSVHIYCIRAHLTHWRNMSPEKDRQEIKNRAMCTAPAASAESSATTAPTLHNRHAQILCNYFRVHARAIYVCSRCNRRRSRVMLSMQFSVQSQASAPAPGMLPCPS